MPPGSSGSSLSPRQPWRICIALAAALFLFGAWGAVTCRDKVELKLWSFNISTAASPLPERPPIMAFMYSSHTTPELCATVRSLLHNGWTVTVLGGVSDPELRKMDITWHKSFGKVAIPVAWLGEQPKDQLLIGMDAFDILAQLSPADVLAAYQAIGSDVAYSAEHNCWPFSYWADKTREQAVCDRLPQPPKPQLPRFVNTGVVIGPAGLLHRLTMNVNSLLKYHQQDFALQWPDDQAMVTYVLLNDAFDIKLDYYSRISKSMDKRKDDLEPYQVNGRHMYRDKLSNSTPALLHFNGDKGPFNQFNGSLWFDKLGHELPHDAHVLDAKGRKLSLKHICGTR